MVSGEVVPGELGLLDKEISSCPTGDFNADKRGNRRFLRAPDSSRRGKSSFSCQGRGRHKKAGKAFRWIGRTNVRRETETARRGSEEADAEGFGAAQKKMRTRDIARWGKCAGRPQAQRRPAMENFTRISRDNAAASSVMNTMMPVLPSSGEGRKIEGAEEKIQGKDDERVRSNTGLR